MKKNGKTYIITNSVTWNYKSDEVNIITEEDNKTDKPRFIFNELLLKYENILDFNKNNVDLIKIGDRLKKLRTKKTQYSFRWRDKNRPR